MAGVPLQAAPTAEVERLRSIVAKYFPVYETRITPRSLILLVHLNPSTLEQPFDDLRRELWGKFYVPQIRFEGGEYFLEIVRRPVRTVWRPVTNLVLLALTIASTVAAGAFLWLAYRGGSQLRVTDWLYGGLSFGLPLLAILGLHELAHFVMARHHHVEASLPYFIPVPPPFLLFGTFGAFISLREPIPSKKALLDIGASGPLAGFAVAIPVTLAGLFLSAHAPVLSVATCGPTILGVSYGNLEFGSSLFWSALALFVPVSALMNLHPLALAGWVGLLVTAINLLPAGQLDGGHVFRALLGDRSRWVSYAGVALLLALGLFYQGWFLFAILVFVLGMRHPPPLNDITPLDPKRWAVGGLAAAILISGFVVVPIASPNPAFSLSNGPVVQQATSSGMADNLSVLVSNHDLVAHGYRISVATATVVATVNGSSVTLTKDALKAFLRNTTWVVTVPSGQAYGASGNGSYALPDPDYFSIPGGGYAAFHILYSNRDRGVVSLVVTVNELCSGSVGPKATAFVVS